MCAPIERSHRGASLRSCKVPFFVRLRLPNSCVSSFLVVYIARQRAGPGHMLQIAAERCGRRLGRHHDTAGCQPLLQRLCRPMATFG